MQSDIKLNEGTVEMTGDKVKADVGFNGGSIELNGSNLKTSVSNIEMYYYGGHLKAVGGTVQLGSTDSGTFKGFRQAKDGAVLISGDKLTADVRSAEIGGRVNNKFEGIMLSTSGVGCYSRAFMVRNPDVPQTDSQQRIALHQSAGDELVVNAGGNYKGGVKVDGPVKMTGEVTMQGTLLVSPGSKLLLLSPEKTTKLPNGKVVRLPGAALDVLETITRLQETIVQLQNKIALLEKR